MSPIPELLPRARAELTLLAERFAAVADQIRGMFVALARAARTLVRIVWLYNVARQESRHRDLEHAVLDAIDAPPLLNLRRSRPPSDAWPVVP